MKRVPIVLAGVLLLAGCAALRDFLSRGFLVPTVAFNDARVKEITTRAARLDFHLTAENENAFGLQDVRVNYQLYYQDKPFLRGRDMTMSLAPRARTAFIVPAEITYTELFAAAGSLLESLLSGARSVPVRVDISLSGAPSLDSINTMGMFPFSVNVSRTVDIPLP